MKHPVRNEHITNGKLAELVNHGRGPFIADFFEANIFLKSFLSFT